MYRIQIFVKVNKYKKTAVDKYKCSAAKISPMNEKDTKAPDNYKESVQWCMLNFISNDF